MHNKSMLFVFNKFKKRKWLRLNNNKRLKVYAALEAKYAKKQKREPLPVVLHESSNWNCLGVFTTAGGKHRIILHEKLLIEDNMRFHGMETILHEGRHAYQFATINKKLRWWQFRAKRWQKNWVGYVPSEQNNTVYNSQSVEQDAQKYAFSQMLKLHHKFKDDPDYQRTMRINEYRLESADDNARKQFGVFYKHKINKIIDKNSKQNHW